MVPSDWLGPVREHGREREDIVVVSKVQDPVNKNEQNKKIGTLSSESGLSRGAEGLCLYSKTASFLGKWEGKKTQAKPREG